MRENELKTVTIKYDAQTGRFLEIYGELEDGKEVRGKKLSMDDYKKIYESPDGFKFAGLVLHHHSDPCIVHIDGTIMDVCRGW